MWLWPGFLLVVLTGAQCHSRNNIETVIGGKPNSIDVLAMVFDVDFMSNDIVVGTAVQTYQSYPIIYFVRESTCSVQWVFKLFNDAV